VSQDLRRAYYCTFSPRQRGHRGLDGGHAPAGIALMAGEAAWACLMRGRPARTSLHRVQNKQTARLLESPNGARVSLAGG
jgi:hypothetical protein